MELTSNGPQPDILRTRWHGFHTWVDFIRATVSLGVTLSVGIWVILTFALDTRYAPIDLVEKVEGNGQVAKEVKEQLNGVKAILMRDRLFDLQIRRCSATSVAAKQYYSRQMQEMSDEYQRLTGNLPPAMPTCTELR